MDTQIIPKETYYIIGVLILSNIGAVIAFIKSLTNREVQFALLNQEVGNLKNQVQDLKKDIDACFKKIRGE